MKNSLWKLAALAGVVGIVLLAFLQAQRGLESTGNEEFVPADVEEFAESEPDLGTAGELDAPPFDAVDPNAFAAVDDETGRGEPSTSGAPFDFDIPEDFPTEDLPPAGTAAAESDPWSSQPAGRSAEPRGVTDGLSPIRRRRPSEGTIRTAAFDEEPGRVRPASGTVVEPLPELEPLPETDDFGPDLFADDPPSEESPERSVPLPLPSRFDGEFATDGEVEPAGFGDEMPAESETPPGPPEFEDDFPPFEDEPATEEPQPAGDREPPSLEPLPLFDEDPPREQAPVAEPADEPLPEPSDFAPEVGAPSLGEPESAPPALGAPDSFDADSFDAEPAPERLDPLPLETKPLADEPAESRPPLEFGDDPSLEPEPAPARLEPQPEPRRVPDEPAAPIGREDLLGDGTIDDAAPLAAQKPRLTIDKVAPETALLGQPLVYSIVVKNVGETPARKVVIHDRIPRGTELTGTIPRAELLERTKDDRKEKVLRWKLDTIAPGSTKTIRVRVTPLSEGQIGSVATVNFVAEVGARTRVTSPSLEFDLSGPSKARLGKPVVFEFSVRNNGTDTASGVVIRNLLPAGLTHPGGDDLEYAVGDLEPGASKSIRLSLTAAQEGEVVNRAVVTADGGVKVEESARVTIVGTDLVVSRTGPAKRYVGRTAIFTNVVANNGEVPLENVTIVETLPKEIDFVEAASGGQYNPAKHVVAWRVDRLGPKESRVLKVKLRPKSPGRYTCTISAKSETGAEASTEAETQAIGYSALGLDVEGGGPPVFVGDTVTFTVSPKNRGTTNAKNVVVDVTISPELELASVNAPTKYTRDGNNVRFTAMPTLGGGATAGYEITLRAVRPGEGRIRTSVVADDLTKPLQQDAAVRVVAETP